MIQLKLDTANRLPPKMLCLGAHSDDIEIGCGGTILHLAERFPGSIVHWVVFSAIGVRETEARSGVKEFVGHTNLESASFKEFPDGFMPYAGREVKAIFEELKGSISPDLIFTHYRQDAHQDHRLISELTWNTFRDHLILEYEIPKYDGDMGQPNLFVPLPQEIYQRKVRIILDAFQSQRNKRWFEESTLLSLMRIRGMECNSPSGYAEAFHCRKVIL